MSDNPVIDAYNSRADVQQYIATKQGDAFTAGTEANTALNDWWNQTGRKEMKDAQAQANAPAPLPDFQQRYTTPQNTEIDNYYQGLNRAPMTEAEKQAVRDNVRQRYQDRINAIDTYYNGIVARENVQGEGRMGQTRALNSRSGNLGQPMGNTADETMRGYNNQKVDLINSERLYNQSKLYGEMEAEIDRAISGRQAKVDANTKEYLNYLQDKLTQNREQVANFAASGMNLKALQPDQKKYLMEQTGMTEAEFDALWKTSVPKQEFKFEQLDDGTLMRYSSDGSVDNLGQYAPPDKTAGWELVSDGAYPYWVKRGNDGKVYDIEAVEDKVSSPDFREYKDYLKSGGTLDFVSYQNQDSNRVVKKNSGGGSSGGSGGSGKVKAPTKQQRIDAMAGELSQHVGSDGYYDTEVYNRLMRENPDLAYYFKADKYLNPNDATASIWLGKGGGRSV